MADEDKTIPLSSVITIDDDRIRGHLDRVVRGTVEETLNALLEAEADRLCNAQRYERTEARRDTRAGHYERGQQTRTGDVTLKEPNLRRQTFETAIIERYRRRPAAAGTPTRTSTFRTSMPTTAASRIGCDHSRVSHPGICLAISAGAAPTSGSEITSPQNAA